MSPTRSRARLLPALLALTLALVAALGLAARVALADDVTSYLSVDKSSKTITVSDDESDTSTNEIQDAINYIYDLNTTDDPSAKEGWTITVGSGTYSRFTVLDGLNGLTIQAAEGAKVVIEVLDGSSAPISDSYIPAGYRDDSGVMVRIADDVTFKGLTFRSGGTESSGNSYSNSWSDNWYLAAISLFADMNNGYGCGKLTVTDCVFVGTGSEYGIFTGTNGNDKAQELYVSGCTFDGLYAGICWMSDGGTAENVSITNNAFVGCDRAVDGYFGNGGIAVTSGTKGTFAFTNNTVTGTEELYCKVLLCDQYATTTTEDHDATGVVTLSGNTLENACMILFNMETNLDLGDLTSDNTFGDNTYYATGSEATNVVNLVYALESDKDQVGYWEVLKTSVISRVGYDWTDGELELVTAAAEEANASGSHTLTLDFSSLYSEETWKSYVYTIMSNLKYGVRWVGTESDDDPEVEKDVDQEYVVAGDEVDFSLTVSVPEYLYLYFEDDIEEEVTEEGSYVVTVHDTMDSVLELDASSIVVTIDGAVLDSSYYTVTTSGLEDGCAFEIEIDLVSLVEAGILEADDSGAYPDVVIAYTATVSDDAENGDYDNTTWVTYEAGGTSDESTATVKVRMVDVTVSKVWDDSDDEDGIRPDSVTVQIYADGEAVPAFEYDESGARVEVTDEDGNVVYMTLVLSEENSWTDTFEDLPAYAYDDDGEPYKISYSVEEVAVDGYDASLTGVSFTIGSLTVEITNTHEVTVDEPEDDEDEEEPEEESEEATTEEEAEESEDEETTTEEEEEAAEVPDTGDATSLTWAATALAGLAAVAGALALRRRARR